MIGITRGGYFLVGDMLLTRVLPVNENLPGVDVEMAVRMYSEDGVSTEEKLQILDPGQDVVTAWNVQMYSNMLLPIHWDKAWDLWKYLIAAYPNVNGRGSTMYNIFSEIVRAMGPKNEAVSWDIVKDTIKFFWESAYVEEYVAFDPYRLNFPVE